MNDKGTITISGGMTGIPHFNFPEFDDATFQLALQGFEVLNPAQQDRDDGFDAMALPEDYDWFSWPTHLDKEATIRRDLENVFRCTHIYMLEGWENSKGARTEHALAFWLGRQIIYQTPPIQISVNCFNINSENEGK